MLNQKRVDRVKEPGKYACGLVRGLYLQVSASRAKSWLFIYELNHRRHEMGLGTASVPRGKDEQGKDERTAGFTLKEARERARLQRQLLADGRDPLQEKRAAKAAAQAAAARKLSFREAARRYFDQHEKSWRSASHRDAFLSTLAAFVFPAIGNMDIATIGTPDILRCFESIWATKSITADRVRGRVERVIDWAIAREFRPPGTNPARWSGHLDQILPAPRTVAPVKHHAAMDYRQLPAFMAALRREQGTAARALEFLIHVSARSGEVTGATWDEIDFDSKTWIIPEHRMKSGREHRSPLSQAAIDLLNELPRMEGDPHIFVAPRRGSGLNKMAMRHVLERLGHKGSITIHGFRSAYSDFCHERTSHSVHTIEISLAHTVGTEVERAYRRTDMIAKRARLAETWSRFLMSPPAKGGGDVVTLRRKTAP